MQNEHSPAPVVPHSTRRSFMAATGMASAALLGSSLLSYKPSIAAAAETARFQSGKKKFAVNDTDILNFALNLEYLEAEFYLRATTGSGLPDADITGIIGDTTKKKDTAAAGILGTEAYHAGGIRMLLLQAGQTTASIITAANAISAARAKLDGTNN